MRARAEHIARILIVVLCAAWAGVAIAVSLDVTVSLYDRTNSREYRKSVSITTSNSYADGFVREIGTNEESIVISDDTMSGQGPGYLYLVNTTPSNYVEVGFATGEYVLRLDASYPALLPMNSSGYTTLYFRADSYPCVVEGRIQGR